jgi:iron(III) transport system permease protein
MRAPTGEYFNPIREDIHMLRANALPDREKRFYFDIKWVLIFLIVAFMLVFQVFPLLYMVYRALFSSGEFSLEALKRIYTYDLNWMALKNTLIGATFAMIFGTIIAFPLAWLVGRTNMYGRKFFRSLFVLTYMVPPYLGAMAWLRLLNPKVGNLNVFIRDLLHLSANPFNIYTLGGLIWVLTSFYYPYAFITISRAMEKMDPSLEEASRVSGASPLRTLFTVTLPMMTPSIVSGAMLVFVSAASCFGIPSIVGMPGQIYTVTTRIVDYVSIGNSEGLTDATCLALFLMILAAIILYSSDFIVGRRQYITVSGKSTRPNIVDLRRWRIPVTIAVAAFAFIVVILPFATVAFTSITKNLGKSLLAEGNITFKHWETVLTRDRILKGMRNSLTYATIAATVGIVIACVMAYLLQRTQVKGKRIPDFLITLGSGSPSVVIALGLIMTMTGRFGINIYNTMYIMIIAYLIKYQMMGMRTVVSAISQIHVSLEESSQISGASWLRTMKNVTLPLIGPSIAAGWFLIFIPSFYELSMSTLLYSSNTVVIGVQLHEYWTFTSQQQASAMAFGILVVVVLLNFILNKLTKGNFSI